MTEHDVNLFSDQRRSNWIRLRTLIFATLGGDCGPVDGDFNCQRGL